MVGIVLLGADRALSEFPGNVSDTARKMCLSGAKAQRKEGIMNGEKSAEVPDPTLYCKYFGGPRDGFKTADLPPQMSGQKLTGAVTKLPLAEPTNFSLFAVYVCTSQTQIDGWWEFHFQGLEGPNGEKLIAQQPEPQRARD